MPDPVALTLPADSAAMAKVQAAVDAFCETHEMAPRPAYVLALVVEELVTNVVNHAYKGTRGGPVTVFVGEEAGAIVGEVSDDGPPFDPTVASTPDTAAALDERPIGGLGVHIVKTLVERLDYARDGDRNVVRFRIPL